MAWETVSVSLVHWLTLPQINGSPKEPGRGPCGRRDEVDTTGQKSGDRLNSLSQTRDWTLLSRGHTRILWRGPDPNQSGIGFEGPKPVWSAWAASSKKT